MQQSNITVEEKIYANLSSFSHNVFLPSSTHHSPDFAHDMQLSYIFYGNVCSIMNE